MSFNAIRENKMTAKISECTKINSMSFQCVCCIESRLHWEVNYEYLQTEFFSDFLVSCFSGKNDCMLMFHCNSSNNFCIFVQSNP